MLQAISNPKNLTQLAGCTTKRRSGDGSARHEQPFNLLEPEAGVAHPLVDLDPRRAFVAQDCFQHGALHSAHAADPQPGGGAAQISAYGRAGIALLGRGFLLAV
jgi:hypothetical protein